MTRRAPALATAILLAARVGSAEPLSTAAFEALAEGHVLRFTQDGAPFGVEQFFPGRRSLWQYRDGTCAGGVWWPDAGLICFRYEAETVSQCWRFEKGAGGVSAELVEAGAPTGLVVELSGWDTRPLACPGPRVGT